MSSELPLPPRRGRRDNGLDAAMYVPLADVDPRIGEHLLDVLKIAGVPAYLEPSADVEPYTRALALPSPPTDRLWVDREQRTAARDIVEAEVGTPQPRVPGEDRPSRGLSDAAEEQAWQQIVADFDDGPNGPDLRLPPWPVVEDASLTDEDDPPDGEDPDGGSRADNPLFTSAGGPGPDPTAQPDEGHFVPPPPPPIPRLSKHTLAAIILLAAGGMMLVAPSALGFGDTTGFALGVAAIVCSAGLLVWRLGERRSDDGPDDGAIV
ncbi:MAG TPA: hypothetical protein VFX70_08285 [Mycobacteriales bacterium]|nr:hypothetical protein [Mycobacteriales bacterium]